MLTYLENGAQKKENRKRDRGKLKMEGEEELQNEERTEFFLPGKSISRQEKNQEKGLCPL